MYEIHTDRELGPLDQMFKPFFWCYLLCFRVSDQSKNSVRDVILKSLQSLVLEHPNLAGSLQRLDDSHSGRGQMHFKKPKRGLQIPVEFAELDSPNMQNTMSTYDDLAALDFPLKTLDSDIIAPLTSGKTTTKNVMAVQANFLQGGLILAMCFHHNFVDGSGAAQIIARFSEHCARSAVLRENTVEIPSILTYTSAQSNEDYDTLKREDRLWRLNCLETHANQTSDDTHRWPEVIPSLPATRDINVVSRMFGISSQALNFIKNAAQPAHKKTWVSSNDALVAFLWRHIVRARFPDHIRPSGDGIGNDRISRAIVALNGRQDLGLPNAFTGNCVFHCYTDLTVSEVSSREVGIDRLARQIRQSINETRDSKLLKRVIALAASIPDVSTVKYGNDNLGTDVYTTSWAALPFYSLDFGVLGKMDYLRIPDRHFETLCCILPPRNGTTEVILSMKEADLSQLKQDKEFLAIATEI